MITKGLRLTPDSIYLLHIKKLYFQMITPEHDQHIDRKKNPHPPLILLIKLKKRKERKREKEKEEKRHRRD